MIYNVYFLTPFQDYSRQNEVIVTQLPLKITIAHFWKIIAEQRVKVIVQLERHVRAQLCPNGYHFLESIDNTVYQIFVLSCVFFY